jgi:hypothetical protein
MKTEMKIEFFFEILKTWKLYKKKAGRKTSGFLKLNLYEFLFYPNHLHLSRGKT